MADRAILFSKSMVLSLLAGTKTQTRRILKWGNEPPVWDGEGLSTNDPSKWGFPYYDKSSDSTEIRYLPNAPRIKVGDRLWVREVWKVPARLDKVAPRDIEKGTQVYFVAVDRLWPVARYRQAIHMPRWASRLTQVVEAVRVERLQDIQEEDAWAEGVCTWAESMDKVRWGTMSTDDRRAMVRSIYGDPVNAYRHRWEHINGADSWSLNPWVSAISFQTHRCNIDEMPSGDRP